MALQYRTEVRKEFSERNTQLDGSMNKMWSHNNGKSKPPPLVQYLCRDSLSIPVFGYRYLSPAATRTSPAGERDFVLLLLMREMTAVGRSVYIYTCSTLKRSDSSWTRHGANKYIHTPERTNFGPQCLWLRWPLIMCWKYCTGRRQWVKDLLQFVD